MKDSELRELWDALRGFDLNALLVEITEAPIPFIDNELGALKAQPNDLKRKRIRKRQFLDPTLDRVTTRDITAVVVCRRG